MYYFLKSQQNPPICADKGLILPPQQASNYTTIIQQQSLHILYLFFHLSFVWLFIGYLYFLML